MPDISLTTPTDYTAQLSEIERRRALATALQQQSMQPLESSGSVGGVPTKISPYAGLAKMLNSFTGAWGQHQATEQQTEVGRQYRADLQDTLSRALQAGSGSPGRPAMQDPQELQQQADQGTAAPAPIAAQAPDPQAAAAILMGHPGTQALGQQQLMQEMSRKALIAALQGGNGAQAAPQAAGGAQPVAAPTAPAQAGPAPGGPAGGVPMAVWLQSDPSGKSYIEQLAKDNVKSGEPVVNRGYGVGRMVNGAYVPDPASLTQALDMERGKQGIAAPMEPPITLDLSGGQKAQLSRPEYAEFQKTNQLPQRYGAQPPAAQPAAPVSAPASAPQPRSNDRARILSEEMASEQSRLTEARQKGDTAGADLATRNIAQLQKEMGTGLGTPGLTQSQGDIINQERQRAGGKEVDTVFGKDYAAFVQGGAADATKQLAQLGDTLKALQAPGANLTGPVLGHVPDAVKSFINPQAVAMRERVEEVVQRSLRAILGAQFTEKEGERLIARAYNPSQPEAENAVRVQRLYTQLEQSLKAKTDAAKYFETNGTLQGWAGKLPTLADFDSAVAGAQGASGKINAAPQQRRATDKAAGVKFLGFEQQNANR